MQEVTTNLNSISLSAKVMMEAIRSHHIDIEGIIKEELQDILPQYIEDIIRNMYNIEIEGVK